MKRTERELNYLDVLTVISVIAVVFLHANGVFWSRPAGRLWITSNIIETVFYYAVPIFFMITGATLINYSDRYTLKEYFLKRINRTVIPFVIWSCVSYVVVVYIFKNNYDGNVVFNILNYKYMAIYWFFIPLFAIYLTIPILAKLNIYIYIYISFYIFISYSLIPFIEIIFGINYQAYVLHEFKFNPIAGGLLLYPILGYVIANIEIKRCYRVCIYILGIFALLLHCVGTIYLSPEDGINRLFKGYMNFPCVFYSVSVFLFCKYTDWSFLSKDDCLTAFFIKFIKQNSLGVYLIHGYFVYYIVPYLHIDNRSIFYRTIGALLIVFICAFISHLIRKIPIVKRSLG